MIPIHYDCRQYSTLKEGEGGLMGCLKWTQDSWSLQSYKQRSIRILVSWVYRTLRCQVASWQKQGPLLDLTRIHFEPAACFSPLDVDHWLVDWSAHVWDFVWVTLHFLLEMQCLHYEPATLLSLPNSPPQRFWGWSLRYSELSAVGFVHELWLQCRDLDLEQVFQADCLDLSCSFHCKGMGKQDTLACVYSELVRYS